MEKIHFIVFQFLLILCISGLWGVSLAHDSTRSPSMEIPAPALFRGSILTHLPLLVFPLDSTGGSVAWVPIPEMGVIITPSFKTENYQFEFPIS
ncbi:hypothetical protein JW877_07865, partial [bacterium]|nr:hypothetical protein [bacterium]